MSKTGTRVSVTPHGILTERQFCIMGTAWIALAAWRTPDLVLSVFSTTPTYEPSRLFRIGCLLSREVDLQEKVEEPETTAKTNARKEGSQLYHRARLACVRLAMLIARTLNRIHSISISHWFMSCVLEVAGLVRRYSNRFGRHHSPVACIKTPTRTSSVTMSRMWAAA